MKTLLVLASTTVIQFLVWQVSNYSLEPVLQDYIVDISNKGVYAILSSHNMLGLELITKCTIFDPDIVLCRFPDLIFLREDCIAR